VLLTVLSLLLLAPPPAVQPSPVAEPEVAAIVTQVLGAAQHPRLRWGSISDVSRDLWPLYDAEPDRLLWFDGSRPLASVEGAVLAVNDARAFGLNPDDYDAAGLQVQWVTIKSGRATAADRAHFDLALSIAGARMVRAVYVGRVDPALLRWKYDGPRKALDPIALLQEARAGRGLGDVLRSLEPKVPHYIRARATLATYRALAEAGEPPVVPSLDGGVKKIVPGQAWSGTERLAARLRAVGDLVTEGEPASTTAPTHYAGVLVDAV